MCDEIDLTNNTVLSSTRQYLFAMGVCVVDEAATKTYDWLLYRKLIRCCWFEYIDKVLYWLVMLTSCISVFLLVNIDLQQASTAGYTTNENT